MEARKIDDASEVLRKLVRSSWQAIAWEKHDALPDDVLPQGVRCSRDRPIHLGMSMSATGGNRGALGASHRQWASASSSSSTIRRRSKNPCQPTGGSPASGSSRRVREQCKEERSMRINAARLNLIQLRAPTSIIPCTRFQWAVWLGENIEEFRRRMHKDAAPKRRRDVNIRVDKRPGLPTPVKRIQPQEDRRRPTTEWGKLLEWRTGWYGFGAASGRRLFYMVRHLWITYVIDLESHRVQGEHPYHLSGDFSITDSMMPLSTFERKCSHDEVHTVYEFDVKGSGPMPAPGGCSSKGTLLKIVGFRVITTPVPARCRSAEADDDSCEDLGLEHQQSDLEEDVPAVDTDEASFDESGKTTASDTELSTESEVELDKKDKAAASTAKGKATGKATGVPATGGLQPATGGLKPAKYGRGGPTIFDNGYFIIKGNEMDLKMHIHQRWLLPPPVGIGRQPTMSKTLTPSTIGETREDPTCSTMLLKAWMLWRVRQTPGWIESTSSRKRLFTEEADLIFVEIKRIQPKPDGLLGNPVASRMLHDWVPDIVAKVKATGGPG